MAATFLARASAALRLLFKRDITAEQFATLGLFTPPAAGIAITPEVASGISAVYCADRVIAEDLASLPMLAYEGHRLDDGAKPLPEHHVSKLLADPNPEQTAPVFWAGVQHDANYWGYGLAEIVWDGSNRAVELWHLPAPTVTVERRAGKLVFVTNGRDGSPLTLDLGDVLFIPGFSPDGSIGYRLLNLARLTIGAAAAVQQFTANRFKAGMRPSGAIKHPGLLSDSARENMRASWEALYGGLAGAGKPMLLEEGTAWEPFEIAHNDQLQLAQLGEQLVDEVCRFFNISPVKLHKLARATWANLETLQRAHVTDCLGPWIRKRDAEVERKLMGPGVHCRHVVDGLLTADTSTRFTAWGAAVKDGWMTPNEVRRREDLPPKKGGDELRLQAGVTTAPGAPAGDQTPPPADDQVDDKTPPPTPPEPPKGPTDGTVPPKPNE